MDYPVLQERTDIRLSFPSKGRLAESVLDFFSEAGLRVYKPNPRQYIASIPSLPGLTVLFQRASDIVTSIRDGSIDFGVTGWDLFRERAGDTNQVIPLYEKLGFGRCTLNVIVPGNLEHVHTMADLANWKATTGHPLRIATKFPLLTQSFFQQHQITDFRLVDAEGTLETAPSIGYADVIVDLISTGITLRDNHLRALEDGQILESEACLIANRQALKSRPEVLTMIRLLLEFIEAHIRAKSNLAIFANIRGNSPDEVARQIFSKQVIGGLQGPTISPIITPQGETWYAVNIVVHRHELPQAIAELREIGGSGVIVTPVTYIFEEEPPAWKKLLAMLEDS